MKILIWHVHGSWTTAFVQGDHEYLVPVLPDRGPDGRGRARTWQWPATVREVTPSQLRGDRPDVVVLQRPHEADLLHRWTGLRAGVDLPAVYLEHNAPTGPAAASVHPMAGSPDLTVVHVTRFNEVMWDNGSAPTTVIEHGVIDPGHRYVGSDPSLAVVVNEPVRRTRVAGTDLVLRAARRLPVHVYGMGMAELAEAGSWPAGYLHEDVAQAELHGRLGTHRAYLHPYRWTSLGLSLIEAMLLGLPVLALSTTEAPDAVPAAAGLVSNDLDALLARARAWFADPDAAREAGLAGRAHALRRYGLTRFLDDWDALLKEVAG